MSSTCASKGNVVPDATQRELEEEKDYQIALSLWSSDAKAAAARARRLRRRNFSRRDGLKLSLTTSKKKKSFKQPRDSALSSEEWKKRCGIAQHALTESRAARDFQHRVSRSDYIFTPFLPFVKSRLEREAIARASELGAVWKRYRRDKRSSRRAPSRVIIEERDYEDVLEQLRVNAGFYEERSSEREVSEIDEFELLDSDEVVIEEEEEEEEIEPLIGRMAPTVWHKDGVTVYLK